MYLDEQKDNYNTDEVRKEIKKRLNDLSYSQGPIADEREAIEQNKVGVDELKNLLQSQTLFLKARKGDNEAQLQLAKMYTAKAESLKDITQWEYADRCKKKAFEWYKKAAENGNVEAQFALGNCYRSGIGMSPDPKNLKKAYEWYKKAAENGDAKAQNLLGHCYTNGYGVEKNERKAFLWYEKAAMRGNVSAMNNVAYCYRFGLGVPVDLKTAITWYKLSAAQNDAYAMNTLGDIYSLKEARPQEEAKNQQEAYEWYKKAAEKGDPEGLYKVAGCLMSGIGVEKNEKEAFTYYLSAANNGHTKAKIEAIRCYTTGTGVEKNEEEAKRLEKHFGIRLDQVWW